MTGSIWCSECGHLVVNVTHKDATETHFHCRVCGNRQVVEREPLRAGLGRAFEVRRHP